VALAAFTVAIVIATLVASYAAISHGIAESDQRGEDERPGSAAVLREEATKVHARAQRG
jgi:hypothetical protein